MTEQEDSPFYLAKYALQVLDNAVMRCENENIIELTAKVERYAQTALRNKEIDKNMYDLRIKNYLGNIADSFKKNCLCKHK